MRRKRTRGRSSGQTLVEFALIILPFVIAFFSIVEISLIIASVGSFNFAAREGARLGSIEGRTFPAPDNDIIRDVTAHVSGVVMATWTEIDIFRATSDGQCLQTSTGAGLPSVPVDDPACIKGVYVPAPGNSWVLQSGGWDVNDRNDTLTNADYIGVRVKFNYNFLTGFVGAIGTSLSLSSTSAQRIEPQDFQAYRPAATTLASASQSGYGTPLWQLEPVWKEARA
jgi:Flp pilus assembly protein TadG